jgi:glutathione S-transferase
MMILRSAAPSPFARKVRIALAVLGLNDVKIEPADTMDARDTLRQQNVLGKIPVLIGEDGVAYYDSRVILEYLDHLAGGGKIIPREAARRFAALRLQALCDGILDASILAIYEGRWRAPDKYEPKWLEHQAGKVQRALAELEKSSRCRLFPMSATSRSLARSAIGTSALVETGGPIARGWLPGSMISRPGCPHMRRPRPPSGADLRRPPTPSS